MFTCEKCGGQNVRYVGKDHEFVCPDCGMHEAVPPVERHCPACGTPYIGYTWFDPSGCSACYYSFVD